MDALVAETAAIFGAGTTKGAPRGELGELENELAAATVLENIEGADENSKEVELIVVVLPRSGVVLVAVVTGDEAVVLLKVGLDDSARRGAPRSGQHRSAVAGLPEGGCGVNCIGSSPVLGDEATHGWALVGVDPGAPMAGGAGVGRVVDSGGSA